MPEEITVTQPEMTVSSGTDLPRSTTEYVLYKLDRSIAIAGIIAIAIVAIFCYGGNEGVQIATGAVGGLVGYVGGRTGK